LATIAAATNWLSEGIDGTGETRFVPAYNYYMVSALSKAFEVAGALPEDRQELIASLIMTELESDAKWEDSFRRSGDQLGRFALAAWAEFESGETIELPIPKK